MLQNPAPISAHYVLLLRGELFQSLLEVRNSHNCIHQSNVVPIRKYLLRYQTLPHIHIPLFLYTDLHPKLRNLPPTYFRSVRLLHGTHFSSGLPRYAYAAACCYWKNWSYLLLSPSSSCWNCWTTYWRKFLLHPFSRSRSGCSTGFLGIILFFCLFFFFCLLLLSLFFLQSTSSFAVSSFFTSVSRTFFICYRCFLFLLI